MQFLRFFFFAALLSEGVLPAVSNDKWEQKVDESGSNVQQLKIEAPVMTEEDQYGYTMPDRYRCDACKVVAYHLSEALKVRQPKNRRLQEWEYQDIFDETCKTGLAGYGITLLNGENVLSGPALKRDDLQAGMGAISMGGETWEKRLGEICRKFVYEKIGEDELYDHFRAKGEVSSDLCFLETRDCKQGPKALPKAKASKLKTKHEKVKKQKQVPRAEPELSLNSFVGKLAKQHGFSVADYTSKRSYGDWEKLFVDAAARITKKHSEAGDVSITV